MAEIAAEDLTGFSPGVLGEALQSPILIESGWTGPKMLTWLSEGLLPFQGGVSATIMRESSMRKMVKVRQLWREPEALKQRPADSCLPSFHFLPLSIPSLL